MTGTKAARKSPGFAEAAASPPTVERKQTRGISGAKRAVNLRISASLIDDAKALGVNLSEVFQTALQMRVQDARNAKFARENAGALASIDAFFEAHGTLSDHFAADPG